MNDSTDGGELLARLQAADPAKRAPVPSDDWINDLTEAIMNDLDETRSDPARRRTWMLVAAAAVVVGALGIWGVTAMNGGDTSSPPAATDKTVTQLGAPPESGAKCMVPSAEVLAGNAQTAVDATVVSIEGDQVTMDVSHWYAGEPTDQVVVTAPSADMQALIGAVELEQGGRYLLAGTHGQLMVCGFSGPYDDSLVALYDEAFGT